MAHGLLINSDVAVTHWAFEKFNVFSQPVDMAVGVTHPELGLVGAFFFHYYNGHNVELSYYGPGTVSSGIVRAMARITLSRFNASRLTVVVRKKRKRLLRVLPRFGFRLEGVQRRHFGPTDGARDTGVRFVLFREDLEKLARTGVERQTGQQQA